MVAYVQKSMPNLLLRLCAHCCLLVGAVALVSYGYFWADARIYQAIQNHHLDAAAAMKTQHAQQGSLVGRIEIPRIGLSVVVLEGDDEATLLLGAGRIPDTAWPGMGNLGIAAHRDTFFRPLRSIRPGDAIQLKTLNANYVYRVESTQIVRPSDVEVLDATSEPMLTLITCYPFSYVGSAPDRFIVHARQISSSPRASASIDFQAD